MASGGTLLVAPDDGPRDTPPRANGRSPPMIYDTQWDRARLSADRHLRTYAEMASNYGADYIAGGATQNSIGVAQEMLQIHGATSLIGCIGKEKFGKEMKKNAKLAVVNVHYYEHENAPTGTCAVYVVGGERYDTKWKHSFLAGDEHLPMYDKMANKYSVDYIAGGATQNSIGVAQILGATSYIVKDKLGEEMKKNAKLAFLNVHYYEDENAPTGTGGICVVGGERSLAANLSVANCYKSDLKESENLALAERAKYIYYPAGLFLTESPDFIQLVVEHAAANNQMCMMNLSASFICAQEEDLLYMDFVFGNETQTQTFSEVHCWEIDVVKEIAPEMYQWPKASGTYKRITVMTQGPDPVVVEEDGKVQKFPVTKLLKGKLIDINGAGDAFVGGFLSQLVQEKPIEDYVGAGCYASNVIVQGSGCTFTQGSPISNDLLSASGPSSSSKRLPVSRPTSPASWPDSFIQLPPRLLFLPWLSTLSHAPSQLLMPGPGYILISSELQTAFAGYRQFFRVLSMLQNLHVIFSILGTAWVGSNFRGKSSVDLLYRSPVYFVEYDSIITSGKCQMESSEKSYGIRTA
ncbi:hypothetical protein NL676_001167 [Syzygium grande]|nr:hypothetical protein NL676_001167 [Syzygium grande]